MFLYISLYDVGLLILFSVALTVGYYLIVVLRRLSEVVMQVGGILNENRKSIEETIEVLPELLNNSNQVVLGVRKTVEATSSAVTCIEDNLVDTADKVQETMETAMLYARCAGEVVRAVVSAFGKSNEK